MRTVWSSLVYCNLLYDVITVLQVAEIDAAVQFHNNILEQLIGFLFLSVSSHGDALNTVAHKLSYVVLMNIILF